MPFFSIILKENPRRKHQRDQSTIYFPVFRWTSQHCCGFLYPSRKSFFHFPHSMAVLISPILYRQERLREGWHGLRSLTDPLGRRARARASLASPVNIAPTPDDSHDRMTSRIAGTGAADIRNDGRRSWWRAIVTILGRVLSWVRRHRPAISGLFEWALRVHLAVFYFNGRYVNLAMRVVGARFAYTRAQDEPRARYAILGAFLLLQAAGEAASALAAATVRWRDTARLEGLPQGLEGQGEGGHAGDDEEKSVRGASR